MSLQQAPLKLADKLAPRMVAAQARLPSYFYGKWLLLDQNCWKTLYLRYEPDTVRILRENLRRGQTFWDVGANYGLMSLFVASIVGPTGNVVSFEPAPESYKLLTRNIAFSPNIEARPYAVGNEDGMVTMSVQGSSTGSSLVKKVVELSQSYHDVPILEASVPIYRLDTLVEQIAFKPDVIKIDIEGFEVEALRGAQMMLEEIRPTLIIEIHPLQIELSGARETEMFDILERSRYRYEVYNRDRQWALYSIIAHPVS